MSPTLTKNRKTRGRAVFPIKPIELSGKVSLYGDSFDILSHTRSMPGLIKTYEQKKSGIINDPQSHSSKRIVLVETKFANRALKKSSASLLENIVRRTNRPQTRQQIDNFASNLNRLRHENLRHLKYLAELFKKLPSVQFVEQSNELSPDQILERLKDENVSDENLRNLIVHGEVLKFEPNQISELVPILHKFILDYRSSNDSTDQVAVGSAVRKMVAYLDQSSFHIITDLLDSGHRNQITPEIELELVKSIVRKLKFSPFDKNDALPELSGRLEEIVRVYLNSRMLSRKNYGAIVLNAFNALFLLRSDHFKKVLTYIEQNNVEWFSELLKERTERLMNQVEDRFKDPPSRKFLKSLRKMYQMLKNQK